MSFGRWSVSLIAALGIAAASVAAATIWLLLTDPVGSRETMDVVVQRGDLTPLLQALGNVIYDALKSLFGYL
jgi:hypothetical protein